MRDDDSKAFIDADYRRVVSAVAVASGDRQRAEDAVQEAVVDVWEAGREVDDLAGWVTTTALNRARSRWRTAAAEQRPFERLARRTDVGPDVSEPPAGDGPVAAALAALPPRRREAIALHYLLDMSVAQVASRLNMAEGTVKTHLHRGRRALQGALVNSDDSEQVDHV